MQRLLCTSKIVHNFFAKLNILLFTLTESAINPYIIVTPTQSEESGYLGDTVLLIVLLHELVHYYEVFF